MDRSYNYDGARNLFLDQPIPSMPKVGYVTMNSNKQQFIKRASAPCACLLGNTLVFVLKHELMLT